MRQSIQTGLGKFFKGCLHQNLLSPLLNTLSQIFQNIFECSKYCDLLLLVITLSLLISYDYPKTYYPKWDGGWSPDFSWLLSFISPKIATKLTNLWRRYEDFDISVLEKTNGNNITDEVSTFFALTYFKYVI